MMTRSVGCLVAAEVMVAGRAPKHRCVSRSNYATHMYGNWLPCQVSSGINYAMHNVMLCVILHVGLPLPDFETENLPSDQPVQPGEQQLDDGARLVVHRFGLRVGQVDQSLVLATGTRDGGLVGGDGVRPVHGRPRD